MKLSEYITGLQSVLDAHGDLDCFYAIDDESNGYQKVNYAGSIYFVHEHDAAAYRPDLYQQEDVDEEHFIKVCVVN